MALNIYIGTAPSKLSVDKADIVFKTFKVCIEQIRNWKEVRTVTIDFSSLDLKSAIIYVNKIFILTNYLPAEFITENLSEEESSFFYHWLSKLDRNKQC